MSETKTRDGLIRALSGARAFPPLILVLFHYCEAHGYRGARWFDAPVSRGYLWVEFFFTLSGFILTYVYAARLRDFWRGHAWPKFLGARLARMYPLHLAMLLLILAMVVGLRALAARGGYVSIYDERWHPIVTASTFVANLFLVQAWNLFQTLSWNGAAWFVSVEFLLCLLFPLYLVAAQGGWRSATLLILGGAGILVLIVDPHWGLDLTAHNGIFRGMAEFAIGVGFAMMFRELRARGGAPLPEAFHSAAQLVVLALLLCALYLAGRPRTSADLYAAFPIIALVFLLAFDRGILARALQTRVPLVLGEWSFAIYMGQIPLLQFLRHAQLHLYPEGWPWAPWRGAWNWLEPLLVLAIAILWGWVLFVAIEQPANKALRRRPA